MMRRMEGSIIIAVRLVRSAAALDTLGHFPQTVPMMMIFLGALVTYLSLRTGVGLVSNGLTVVALHGTCPKFIHARVR